MRFRSSARNAKLVVEPALGRVEGGHQGRRVGLRAEFRNHEFDSKIAQRELGWTDEERKRVERAILSNKNFNPQNPKLGEIRFYLDLPETQVKEEPQQGFVEAPPPKMQCAYVEVGFDGDSATCREVATEGDFCEKHSRLVALAAAAEGS